MDEVNSHFFLNHRYVAHFMLVYNSRAVLWDCPAVPGQLQPYSTILAVSTSDNELGGVIPGDLLSFNFLLLTVLHFSKSEMWWSNFKLLNSYSENHALLLWKVWYLIVWQCLETWGVAFLPMTRWLLLTFWTSVFRVLKYQVSSSLESKYCMAIFKTDGYTWFAGL